MTRLFALTLTAWLCAPSEASFQVRELMRIPAEPGQLVYRVKTDSQGNLIVAAAVSRSGWLAPGNFALIKKLDPSGNELFSRILPGVVGAPALAIDNHDDIYAAGSTSTPSAFPFTNKLTPSGEGAFILKLRGRDGTIVYSTSWGSVGPTAIAVDAGGQVLVAGSGSEFPTTPGAYAAPAGFMAMPMYLVGFSPAGDQILFTARWGGQNKICFGSSCVAIRFTTASQVLFDRQGNIWAAGTTNTTDLPVTPDALKPACGCGLLAGDGFLAKFSADGTRLLYATYLGTSGFSTSIAGDDQITTMAADRAGHLWLAGSVDGPDLPVTANAVQKQWSGAYGPDGFLAEYDPATNQLLYATYFGGAGSNSITDVQVQPDGTILFAGHSNSAILPVAVSGFSRGSDFLASLDPVTYTVTALTRFPNGSTGAGLASTPSGFVLAGASNVAARLESNASVSPVLYAVTNSAGIAVTGQISPGELVTFYGAGIGPPAPIAADLGSGQAPTQLAGVQVLVGGVASPVLYVQDDQVNAIIPFGVSGLEQIVINRDGVSSNPASLEVIGASPEVFKTGPNLLAAALNQDGSLNSDSNRAPLGTLVSVFGTGFGAMTPQPADGQAVNDPLPSLNLPVQVTYLDRPLEITYAGPAPTLVGGVAQVNFRLPPSTLTPNPEFQLLVGGWPSTNFVIPVK